MVTSFLSLLSHSQVWAVEEEGEVGEGSGAGTAGEKLLHIGGRSNRAKEEFKTELNDLLDELPEYM
jgi:cytochrome c biogenesis protein